MIETLQPHPRHRVLDAIRQFNKRVYNPFILRIVRFLPFYGVIHHTGRKSGKTYRTPIALGIRSGVFYIPLPYGEDTDWHRNIRAARSFMLEWKGRTYSLIYGQTVDAAEALPAFSRYFQRGLRAAGCRSYVRATQPA